MQSKLVVEVRTPTRAEKTADLVIEIKRLRSVGDERGAKRALNELAAAMYPAMEALAKTHFSKQLGSLEIVDVVQVGMIEVIKCVDRYDPSRASAFTTLAQFYARRSMHDFVRLQSADVTVSVGVQRGGNQRTKDYGHTNVDIVSRDAPKKPGVGKEDEQFSQALGDSALYQGEEKNYGGLFLESNTPESLFSDEEQAQRVRDALKQLPSNQRILVCRVYGMGGYEQQSVRDISAKSGVSRAKVDALLKAALASLAETLSEGA